jgi:hypothetical protein
MYLPSGLKRSWRKRQFLGRWGADAALAGAGASWPSAVEIVASETLTRTISAVTIAGRPMISFPAHAYRFVMCNSASPFSGVTDGIIVYWVRFSLVLNASE